MQTFLPVSDFRAAAALLDDRRLGKQRVETLQILRALTWTRYGWRHHPAVRMWRGFTRALVCYGVAICEEWEARGRADAVRRALLEFAAPPAPQLADLVDGGEVPPWVGWPSVHRSHQAALVAKDPAYYRGMFPDVPGDLPYEWPQPTFGSWPLRRGAAGPVPVAAALSLVGADGLPPQALAAVEAVVAGRSARLVGSPVAARNAALVAGLSTAGTTLWVTGGEVVQARHPRPQPATQPTGKLSASIARAPEPADLAAMAAEASAAPEFRFYRASQVTPARAVQAGLVVVDRCSGSSYAPVPDVPDVGLPVLTLACEAAPEEALNRR